MDLTNQLNIALKAANMASKVVMEVYNDDFTYQLKEDKSVVTIADFKSDECIKKILLEKPFDNYGILTEESKDNNDRLHKDFCWIVDPLDGTKDFVNKTDNFAINIALSFKGEIVLGVIVVPCKNIIYYATKDNGAYKIENGMQSKINVSNKTSNLKMLVSQFFFNDKEKYQSNPLISCIENCGSSYKAGLISEGKAEFCVKFDDKTKEWDTAPSEIIIKEANGIMLDMYGNKITYNKSDVVNHNGFIIANNMQVFNLFKKER